MAKPALSGPRSLKTSSMSASIEPSWGSRAGLVRKIPAMPHMAPPEETYFLTEIFWGARSVNRNGPTRRLLRTARVGDDRQIGHRQLGQFFRPMQRARIEQQGIARLQAIGLVAVTIDHLAGQHVDQLDALMLKARVRHGIFSQR